MNSARARRPRRSRCRAKAPAGSDSLSQTMSSPAKGSRRLLITGWDAADWRVIHPLMDAGKMPHLRGFIAAARGEDEEALRHLEVADRADPSRPCRSFRPRDTYEVGDRMLHPTFGEGVVQATRGATKVEVLFEAGTKLLVQGYGDR